MNKVIMFDSELEFSEIINESLAEEWKKAEYADNEIRNIFIPLKIALAAPELLEALERMIAYFTPFSERERASEIIYQAQSAIKKATE